MNDDSNVFVTLENHGVRLTSVEDKVEQLSILTKTIQELTISINKLAVNMENMLAEQKEQSERIKALENVPAEDWKSVHKTALSTIVSVVISAITAGLVFIASKYI